MEWVVKWQRSEPAQTHYWKTASQHPATQLTKVDSCEKERTCKVSVLQILYTYAYNEREAHVLFHLDLRVQSVGTDSSRGMKNQNSGHSIFVENEILLWCFNVISYMLNIAAKILFHHHPIQILRLWRLAAPSWLSLLLCLVVKFRKAEEEEQYFDIQMHRVNSADCAMTWDTVFH